MASEGKQRDAKEEIKEAKEMTYFKGAERQSSGVGGKDKTDRYGRVNIIDVQCQQEFPLQRVYFTIIKD